MDDACFRKIPRSSVMIGRSVSHIFILSVMQKVFIELLIHAILFSSYWDESVNKTGNIFCPRRTYLLVYVGWVGWEWTGADNK